MNIHHVFEAANSAQMGLRRRHRPTKCKLNFSFDFACHESVRNGLGREHQRFQLRAERSLSNTSEKCCHGTNIGIQEMPCNPTKVIPVDADIAVADHQDFVGGLA